MKILLISYAFYPKIGGIESISDMLANKFVEKGHDVCLMTKTKDDQNTSFPFIVIRDPGLKTILKTIKWAEIILENNPSLSLSWVNMFLRKPQVTSLQTWIGKPGSPKNIKEKIKIFSVNYNKKIIACSKAIQIDIALNSQVIGNPYNEKVFFKYSDLTKNKDFIFVGRLVSDKGADIAIEAFYHYLNQHNQNSTFTIIGDGEERLKLEGLASKLGIKDKVIFKGALRGDEITRCLNEHKFLIVPSRWKEPFGIVALEGLACGCVPIVSDGGGLPDAVGNAGIVFKSGDIGHLTECMLKAQRFFDNDNYKSLVADHLLKHQSDYVADRYLEVLKNTLI